MSNITLNVNTTGLIRNLKVMFSDRFKVISELVQNARRAKSPKVELTLDGNDLHIRDYGVGISDFQDLLSIAHSGWSNDIATENPYGMGFLSTLFCCESITVHSNNETFTADCCDIIDVMPVWIDDAPYIQGCLITLHNIQANISELTRNIEEVASAQDIPVIWNGLELERPYSKAALIAGGAKLVNFELGCIYLYQGSFDSTFAAFLQGCRLKGFSSSNGPQHVVIYNDNVLARVPDRDHLIDHDMVMELTRKALKAAMVESLLEARTRLNDDFTFVASYASAILKLDPTILNEINFIPVHHINRLSGYTTMDSSGLESDYRAVTREQLKGCYRLDPEVLNETRYEDFASYLIPTYLGLVDGLFAIALNYDSEHWIYSETQEVPTISSADIGLEVVNAKSPFIFESDMIGKTPVVLCDRIVINGPLGNFETDVVAFFDGKQIIVPSNCHCGTVIGQLCSFQDEWGNVDDNLRDDQENQLNMAITRNRVECPSQRFTMLLNQSLSGVERESFSGCEFTLRFGNDGSMVVTSF